MSGVTPFPAKKKKMQVDYSILPLSYLTNSSVPPSRFTHFSSFSSSSSVQRDGARARRVQAGHSKAGASRSEAV